ncbi:Golgin-45 [Bulinus truncatus]|nr:Golgin-45 [Bulinus truncatus]
MSSSKPVAHAKETVLLVQAKPKYNFQNARKLPKEIKATNYSIDSRSEITISNDNSQSLKLYEPEKLEMVHAQTGTELGIRSNASRPVAVVEASRSQADVESNIKTKASQALSLSLSAPSFNSASARQNQSLVEETTPSAQSGHISLGLKPSYDSAHAGSNENLICRNSLVCKNIFDPRPTDSITSSFLQMIKHDEGDRETINVLEQENSRLKADLEVQFQVNSELKRLLVASVGEDLSQRVEKLCRDRAQLSMDIGGFSKKMSEDYENLDKISIQADMWRSKYLASRVMIEELGNAQAYYSLQCHDTQDALQQLLNERHELRTNLLDAYKVLQQVKTAFDPLNSHYSSSLRSTNVLELSRACQQLAEAMRFRLLPAHVAVHIDDDVSDDIWTNSVTRAEQFAHEILSRPTEPIGSLQSGSSRLLPLTGPQENLIKRFHPHTRHENLTFNCCDKCKGEIIVI